MIAINTISLNPTEKVWKAPDPQPTTPDNPFPVTECSAPFTMSELNIGLRSLRTGRAPGQDTIPADMINPFPFLTRSYI